MYTDPAPIMVSDMLGHIKAMNPYLDAMSYFQHSYREKITNLLLVNEPDEENLWSLNEGQQEELEASAKAFAQETLDKYSLSADDLYTGLRGLATLHHAFEVLERTRLADTLKIEQTNEAFFACHSWQAAETFLQLKSIASFPESMMKVILLNSGDQAAIQRFNQEYRGMESLSKIYFEVFSLGIWAEYQATNHRKSRDAAEFIGVIVQRFCHHNWSTEMSP